MSRYQSYPAYKDSEVEWLGVWRNVLHGQRARYGEGILPTLSAELVSGNGKGLSGRNLARTIRFADGFFPTVSLSEH